MRLIIAYIPPDHLEPMIRLLTERGVHGVSFHEVRGFGHEQPIEQALHSREMRRSARIEIACPSDEVGGILDAIYSAAHTGQRGDGKVVVLPIEHAMSLSTGAIGRTALIS